MIVLVFSYFLFPSLVSICRASWTSSPRETRSLHSLAALFGNSRRSRSSPIHASTLPDPFLRPLPLVPIMFARSASLSSLYRSSASSSTCLPAYAPRFSSRSFLVRNLFSSNAGTRRELHLDIARALADFARTLQPRRIV